MKYDGQTVNERLYISGDLKRFDKAIRKRDRETLREIFNEISLEDYNIDYLLEKELTITQKIKNFFS